MSTASGEHIFYNQEQVARIYDLETTTSQLRETVHRSQKNTERLEKEHQHTLDEFEILNKTHSRLEAQFFAGESELAAMRTKLDRSQRTAAALEKNLDTKTKALEKEREGWQRRETELAGELAAAKRRASGHQQRRQTVSAAQPPPVSSHSRSLSMYAHDMPDLNMSSPLTAARTLARENSIAAAAAAATTAAALGGSGENQPDQTEQLQLQVRLLTRKVREAESRALLASDQAAGMHMEVQQALAHVEVVQRKAEGLEHTVKQLSELNESLREDNESYQVLLQMSTMKGGFSFNNARPSLESRASSNNTAGRSTGSSPNAGKAAELDTSYISDELPLAASGNGLDLASELDQALDLDSNNGDNNGGGSRSIYARVSELEEQNTQLKEDLRKTKYERRHLSEENKALSLYVNKILGRILTSSDGLEAVLSRDYDAKQRPLTTFASVSPACSTPPPPPVNHITHPMTFSSMPTRTSTSSRPSMSTATFAEPGSGDGITSVFIPPMSPNTLRANPLHTLSMPRPQSPPMHTRRTRSATVAVGMGDGRQASSVSLTNKADKPAAATISAGGSNGGGAGAWWKRMSVLRLGSAWSPSDESHAE
ncbi:hypothetical protein LPJ66_007757 [Kickxella alabastrina]|uniref:Uncharacterized protein n=1 Tax=Kickxella alabastrina TaxID=61397 RepID=A0ACC1I9E2_9FUNG|nr:hypothetical protein LPJ66_007757 [Kickxella alabastrina]